MNNENDKNGESKMGENISIADVIKMQNDLRRDIDFNKPDEQLTPEELAKKNVYEVLDKAVEESLGSEKKKEIDDARSRMDEVKKFQSNFSKIHQLGKELEKNFMWQQAYLASHFDKGEDNYYKTTINKLTDETIRNEKLTKVERVEMAKKIMEIIGVYRKNLFNELVLKQEVVNSLLLTIRNSYNNLDFSLYASLSKNNDATNLKLQISEWLDLSEELAVFRKMAVEAVEEDIEMDELLPEHAISNEGDFSQPVSGVELNSKGARMLRLVNEANDAEERIGQKREKLAEMMFGKPEEYMESMKEKNDSTEQITPVASNPLHDKAWFRFFKVIYIGAWLVFVGIPAVWLLNDGEEELFWIILFTSILLILIKKGFYYVVLGKTDWGK